MHIPKFDEVLTLSIALGIAGGIFIHGFICKLIAFIHNLINRK